MVGFYQARLGGGLNQYQVAAPDCGHSVFLIPNGVAALVSHRPFNAW
jgi:hypothetical protein